MKASELRIGNYVSYYTGYSTEIGSADLDMIKQAGILFPIPLTEKWLTDFGFIITDGEISGLYRKRQYTTFTKSHLDVDLFEDIDTDKTKALYWFCYTFEGEGGQEIDVEIKHVHQLQNLYFALTSEELILK